jgi:glycosyltransferase 2 family protein
VPDSRAATAAVTAGCADCGFDAGDRISGFFQITCPAARERGPRGRVPRTACDPGHPNAVGRPVFAVRSAVFAAKGEPHGLSCRSASTAYDAFTSINSTEVCLVTRRLSQATWIRLVATVAILGYLLWMIDVRQAGAALAGLSVWHLVTALALVALDRTLMIGRWTLLLRRTGTAISFKSAAWIFLTSGFASSFMPAIGGDAIRAWVLTRRTADGGGAIASVAIDRVLGVVAIVLLGAIGTATWHRYGIDTSWALPFGLALVVGAVLLLWVDRVYDCLVPTRWRTGQVQAIGQLANAVGVYRSVPSTLFVVLLLSLAVQVVRVLQAAVLAAGIGLEVPLGYFLVFMPAGLLLMQLPISIGGFGAPQGVIVWLLELRGVPAESAFVLSTLVVLMGIAGNLPGALLFLRSRRQGHMMASGRSGSVA